MEVGDGVSLVAVLLRLSIATHDLTSQWHVGS